MSSGSRKRSRSATATSVSRTASRVVARAIRKVAEKKLLDLAAGANGTLVNGSTPLFSSCVDIPQGAEFGMRVGNKVSLKSIHIRAHLWSNTSLSSTALAGDASDTFFDNTVRNPLIWRVALIQDKQPVAAGTVPAFSDIYSSASVPQNVLSFQATTNLERFKVLRTWTFTPALNALSPYTTGGVENGGVFCQYSGVVLDEFIPIRTANSELKYSTATATACQMNKTWLVIFNNQAVAAAGTVPAHYARLSIRTRFTDL